MSSHTQVIWENALDNLRLTMEREALSFESEMQRTLVPPLTYNGTGVEVHGQSIPKDDVGGDLVDLVADDNSVVAYVADVSGHGLRAGVLMGMIKTAMRYGLMLHQPLSRLLDDLNRLLPDMKDAHMFATLAALRFDGSSDVEYVSAGHVPLLHWKQRTNEVARYEASQVPLGLVRDVVFTTVRIPFEPGDLFVLVSDGIVETAEELDARAGLERVANIISNRGHEALRAVSSAIRKHVQSAGSQHDDETILLVKALETHRADSSAQHAGSAFPELFEAGWRKLLDGLAAEVTN